MSDSKETSLSEIYDLYVDYYNSAGKNIINHIPVLSEFKNIKELANERVQEITTFLESLYEDLEEILENEIENWNGNARPFSETNQLIKELKEKILSTIEFLIQDLRNSSKEVDTEYVEGLLQQFFKKVNQPNQLDSILFFLAFSQGVKPNYQLVNNHFISLEKICNRIIENNFPSQLKAYGNLSEDEKNDLTTQAKKLGAPLSEDVPQRLIRKVVKSCIENRSNKRFIHQKGKYQGKANKEQIFEFIKNEHPNLVKGYGESPEKGVVPKTIKRRVKKALPDNMT